MTTQNNSAAVKGKKGFQKGMSGNPGGRRKKTKEELDLIAACKARVPEALDVIANIMNMGENERNRLSAALAIIERAYGKPEQPVKADVDGSITVEIVHF